MLQSTKFMQNLLPKNSILWRHFFLIRNAFLWRCLFCYSEEYLVMIQENIQVKFYKLDSIKKIEEPSQRCSVWLCFSNISQILQENILAGTCFLLSWQCSRFFHFWLYKLVLQMQPFISDFQIKSSGTLRKTPNKTPVMKLFCRMQVFNEIFSFVLE